MILNDATHFYRLKRIILLKITASVQASIYPLRACAARAYQVLLRRYTDHPVADVLLFRKIHTLVVFYQRILSTHCSAMVPCYVLFKCPSYFRKKRKKKKKKRTVVQSSTTMCLQWV